MGKKIVGICGKKQTGKNSVAKFIADAMSHRGVKEISLAHPLKYFVIELLDINPRHVWGSDADKNYPLAAWGKIFENDILDKYGKDQYDLLSGREALQVVGTDVMRQDNILSLKSPFREKTEMFLMNKFGNKCGFDSIWIDLCIKDIQESEDDIFIIPDVRFHNEVSALKNAGAKMIRLYRDTKVKDSIPHPSELEMDEMDDDDFDFVVYEHENVDLASLKRRTMNFLYEHRFVAF